MEVSSSIAKGSEGGSKIASELSKGTRFQLYLALRVAGYHEFARGQVPPPFFADDIMETFDDFRAEEAFRLLAGMAATGSGGLLHSSSPSLRNRDGRRTAWSSSTTFSRAHASEPPAGRPSSPGSTAYSNLKSRVSGWLRSTTRRRYPEETARLCKKELGKARAMTKSSRRSRPRCGPKPKACCSRQIRLLCESWNERMWSDGEPGSIHRQLSTRPSTADFHGWRSGAPRCKMPSDVDLAAMNIRRRRSCTTLPAAFGAENAPR